MINDPWNLSNCSEYVTNQRIQPYESTKQFYSFLEDVGCFCNSSEMDCLDLWVGSGDVAHYFMKSNSFIRIHGLDSSITMLNEASKLLGYTNRFTPVYSDILSIPISIRSKKWDLVISTATISWLEDPFKALLSIAQLNTERLAFTSLFYPGRITCLSRVIEHGDIGELDLELFYHTISIPQATEVIKSCGFSSLQWKKFRIEIDLHKPVSPDKIKSFTTTVSNERLLMSGPMMMNWFFCYAER